MKPVSEPLDPPEDADGVAFRKTPVQEVDVVPDASLDAPARVHELEREVVRARTRAQSPLARDGVDPFDDAVFRKLGDGAHGVESRSGSGW